MEVIGPTAPGHVDIALRRGLPGAGGDPGVIEFLHSLGHQGHRRREAAPAVVGAPHEHGAAAGGVARTRGAEVAAALRIEGDGHVVTGRGLARGRLWQGAVLPGRACVEGEVGRDELRVRRVRRLAGGEELARVAGIDRDRGLDIDPVVIVADVDVRDARPRRSPG